MTSGRSKGADGPVGYRKPPKSGQFVKGRSGNPGGRPRRPKAIVPGVLVSEFEEMILEEMDRDVSVREGESIERMPVVRAATRAMALKAAKGDVKAYMAISTKLATIETRRRAQWEDTLKRVMDYKERATRELALRKQQGISGPEIVPHPDDIGIDSKRREIVSNGPTTHDQKMAQDFIVSLWPTLQRDWLDAPRFRGNDPQTLRLYAKWKRTVEAITRLVEKRASKTNSWTSATLEVRMDYFQKVVWRRLSQGLPLEFSQSEFMARIAFNSLFGIRETEEERREFAIEPCRRYLISQGIVSPTRFLLGTF
jgi:Family of unknown function (DUF5681)